MKNKLKTIFYTISSVIFGILFLFFSIGAIAMASEDDGFVTTVLVVLAILSLIFLIFFATNATRLSNDKDNEEKKTNLTVKIRDIFSSSSLKQKNTELENQIEHLKNINSDLLNKNNELTNKYSYLNTICTYTSEGKEKILEEIRQRQEELKSLETINREEEERHKEELEKLKIKNQNVTFLFNSMKKAIKNNSFQDDISSIECLDNYSDLFDEINVSLNCLNIKELRNLYNKNKKNIQKVLTKYEGRYTTKANISIYKLMVIGLESSTQNILSNIKFKKLDQSIEALKDIINKYFDIACNGNQSIAPTMKRFLVEVESLYTESIKIEYEYYVQKERIKEEQKALREQMKQEAEERRQLENEKKKIEKEESKYNNEINNINQIISSTSDNLKLEELQARLKELQSQLNSVKDKKSDIIKLQNGQAGYVYVISNLGSFGDNVFKVGMTRRLEPMDRINELGNASVPFSFDVHSFIFSDNAVDLEKRLHHELNNYRVNKVNLRKEFFRISIDDLEELVQRICPTAEFNKTMLAEQYKQGMSVDNIPDTLAEFVEEDEPLLL